MLREFLPPPCLTCHMSSVMCHMSCAMCHMSCAMCHVSRVMCHAFFLDIVMGLVGGGSVINRPIPSSFCIFLKYKLMKIASC